MGITHNIRCRKCGSKFSRNYGVGFNGQGTLFCDRCGQAHRIDFSGGWECAPTCECGGTFDADSMGRCPQCGSLLSKKDIDPDKPSIHWD